MKEDFEEERTFLGEFVYDKDRSPNQMFKLEVCFGIQTGTIILLPIIEPLCSKQACPGFRAPLRDHKGDRVHPQWF